MEEMISECWSREKYRVEGSGFVSLASTQNGGRFYGNRIWPQNGNSVWRELRSWGYNHANTIQIVASGEGQPDENRPPFYALYWIERIR